MSTDPTKPTAAELLAELLSAAVQAEVPVELAQKILESPKGNQFINAIATERLNQIVLLWQWKDWPLLTPKVKEGSVIGAAQVVTDWLRAQVRKCNCPLPKVAGCEHDA